MGADETVKAVHLALVYVISEDYGDSRKTVTLKHAFHATDSCANNYWCRDELSRGHYSVGEI